MLFKSFVALLYVAVFVSGINQNIVFFSLLLSLVTVCLGFIHLIKNDGDIKIPKYFGLMSIFVITLHLYLFFIKDKTNPFYFAVIFSEGLAYWLIFFNIKNSGEVLTKLLVSLSSLYSIFYLLSKLFNFNFIKIAEMFFQNGPSRHYHIGDLWAFVLILIIGVNWGKWKPKNVVMVAIGFLFLVISNARSAYLSLILGFIYFVSKKSKSKNINKFIPIIFVSLIIGLFLFAGSTKTLLFSRPYFLQSTENFPKFPLGVGMGNFSVINEYMLKTTTLKSISLSNYTHNIFLEALSGVGVFSLFFLIFLFKITKDLLMSNSRSSVWGALLAGILINFMFDTTYAIPGLIWILFITLGVFQSEEVNNKRKLVI